MNFERHLEAHQNLFRNLVKGDGDSDRNIVSSMTSTWPYDLFGDTIFRQSKTCFSATRCRRDN